MSNFKFKITRSFVVETDTPSKSVARDTLKSLIEAGAEEEYLVYESTSEPETVEDTESDLGKILKEVKNQLLGYPKSTGN